MKPDLRTFAYRNNLNKLNKHFSKHVDSDTWDQTKRLLIKHTYFAETHSVGYGLNGNSNMVELQTDIIEAKSVHLERDFWSGGYVSLNLYINTVANTYRGEHLRDMVHLVISKDKKEYSFDVERSGDISDETKRKFQDLFGKLFCKNNSWTDSAYDFSHYADKVDASLNGIGFRVVKRIYYNLKLSMRPQGIKQTSRSLAFAYRTNDTYCSVPGLIQVSKISEVKAVKLADIGVETSGYYDHHVRLEIKPEQAKAARAFATSVNGIIGKSKGNK